MDDLGSGCRDELERGSPGSWPYDVGWLVRDEEGLWTYSEDEDGWYWVDLEAEVLIVREGSGRMLVLEALRAVSDGFFWRVVV